MENEISMKITIGQEPLIHSQNRELKKSYESREMICGSTLKGAQKHQGAQISLQTHTQVFASAIPPPGS